MRDTFWSGWKPLEQPVNGAYFARRLMLDKIECITREFMNVGPIVDRYKLPDSVYTASTSYNADSAPRKACIDNYFGG